MLTNEKTLSKRAHLIKSRKTIVENLCASLWNLREFLHNNGLASNSFIGYLTDAIEDIEVGYLKDDGDSSYAQKLREEKFTMTFDEALECLNHWFERATELDEVKGSLILKKAA